MRDETYNIKLRVGLGCSAPREIWHQPAGLLELNTTSASFTFVS